MSVERGSFAVDWHCDLPWNVGTAVNLRLVVAVGTVEDSEGFGTIDPVVIAAAAAVVEKSAYFGTIGLVALVVVRFEEMGWMKL
jgi:hypothetical protein